MSIKIPILVDNIEYIEMAKNIESYFQEHYGYLSVLFNIRLCSIQNNNKSLFDVIKSLNNNENVLFFLVISDYNGNLEKNVCSNTDKIVLATKSINENQLDIPLLTKIVEGVAPLYIFGIKNIVLSILKFINNRDKNLKNEIYSYQQDIKNKYRIYDILIKYDNLEYYDYYKSDDDYDWEIKDLRCDNLKLIRKGKVRDLYEQEENKILIHTTDRLSAYDRNICEIPYKGKLLSLISCWWFNKTRELVPNHLLNNESDNIIIVKKCKPILIEFVVRGYITGSSKTSMWTNYRNGSRVYCGHKLPEGLVKNQMLENPLITPTTKGKKDELISSEEIIKRGILTEEQWKICEKYALDLFNCGQMLADEKGLILVDTKYEFGFDLKGEIILIDELHTPDSSRYWFKHSYDLNKCIEPENIDKEIIREWIRNNYDPYNLNEDIKVNEEMKILLMNRYIQLHEILTDEKFF